MGKRNRVLFLMASCLLLGLLAAAPGFGATWATGLAGFAGQNFLSNVVTQQSGDGGFLVLGVDDSASPVLAKLDFNGKMVWAKSYSGAPARSAIAKLSDGGGIIASGNWVGRVDAAGTLLWQYTLTGGPSGFYHAVSWDGTSVYLAGESAGNLYVAKVSLTTQQLLWSKVVGIGTSTFAFRATRDGGCIILCSDGVGDGKLVKVDANGTVQKTLTCPGRELC